MVCSVGGSRMKAMARLLEAGSFMKVVPPDDASKQKRISKDIRRELGDADEANLLDEEDMHVFGLNPMDDPLYLVSCNFCKKTINASQYASHAELCKYLGFQKACAEVDDCSRHKKTMRKKRIKVSRYPPDRAMTTGMRTQVNSTRANDSFSSKSYQDDHIGTLSSLSTLTDDSLDGMPKLDVSSVNFGFENHSTATVCHLKRCKLESSEAAVAELGKPHKNSLDLKTNKSPNCSLRNDVPAPLATKMYYPQRSNNLRSALTLMFHKASEIRSCSGMVSSEALEGNLTSPETCLTLDKHGIEFSERKEPLHQQMVCRPARGFQTIADFRPTANITGVTADNLLRPHTAASHGMLNR